MALCAQVGEGPLVPKMAKRDSKTTSQGARARSEPFPRDQKLLTWGVHREMAVPGGTTVPLGPLQQVQGMHERVPGDGWVAPEMEEGTHEVLGGG